MKRVLVLFAVILLAGCSMSAPENVVVTMDSWATQDTDGDGIENELSYTAVVENTGGQRAIDVEAGVYVVYPNTRERIDGYYGSMYGGDKVIIEGHYEVGAKDVRDVIIKRE